MCHRNRGSMRLAGIGIAALVLGSCSGSGDGKCYTLGGDQVRCESADVRSFGWDFSNVAVGASTSAIVLVSNSGDSPTTKFVVNLTPPFGFLGGTYPGAGGTCGSVISAGEVCRLVVAFSPTEIASYEGLDMSIVYAPPESIGENERARSLFLTGDGTAGPNPLAITPSPRDFGTVPISSSSSATFTVTNVASASMAVSCQAFVVEPFSSGAGTCCTLATLAPGSSCTLDVKFAPTQAGYAVSPLELPDSDTVQLLGFGR